MNKLFTKIAGSIIGMAMAIGVGVALNKGEVREAKGASGDPFTFTQAANDSSVNSTDGNWSYRTAKNSGSTAPQMSSGELRIYPKGTITFTGSTNVTLNSATFTCAINKNKSNVYPTGWSTSDGSITTYATSLTSFSVTSIDSSSFTITINGSAGNVGFKTVTMNYTISGVAVNYTITYDANGGTGEMEDTVSANPTVAACTFTPPTGKVFDHWNTEDDDSGDDYAVGATPGADLDLYAIWVDAPVCVTLDEIGADLGSTANAELATTNIVDGTETYTLNYYQCKKQGSAMLLTKDVDAFISNHTEMPGVIESVELFINSGAAGKTTYDVAFGTSEFTSATTGIGAVNITGGNSHEFENNVPNATYFCISLGNSNNGQVLKIVVNYIAEDRSDMEIWDSTAKLGDNYSINYSSTANNYSFYAHDSENTATVLSTATWTSSDETVATVNTVSGVAKVTTVKPGSFTLTARADGYNLASHDISVSKGTLSSIAVSGSMATTDYTTAESWSSAGLTVTATYSTGWEENVTNDVEWSYSPAAPALNVNSVTATATFGGKTADSSAQVVTVSKPNAIKSLYSKTKGASAGEFYGYYVGFATGSGPILMNGEWGIMLFNSSQDVSGWTEEETIIHVTAGTIDIYNGLYEVKSYTIETVGSADIDAPIVHTTTGGETANQANRLTNATGYVSAAPTKGNFTDEAGTNDIQFTYTVGANSFQVFYKKAAQVDADIAVLADSLENETQITLKGFTSWYNKFQLTMTGLVEAVVGYTAEDFAQDLLDQTDAICENYDDVTNNHDAIAAIWSDLADADKYPSLPNDQKTILAEADRNESGTVVEQAMARYDYLTGKYSLSNFINGRTPVVFSNNLPINEIVNNNSVIVIITVISVVGLTALGGFFFIKKRKEQ